MDEQLGSVDAPVIGDGKSSDQILAEIEAIKAQSASESQARPDSANESATQSGDVPDNDSGKQPQTVEVSESTEEEPAPLSGKETQSQGKAVDVNEWMRKKGFRSVEDMAKSLRNLEQELSRRPAKTLDETRPAQPDLTIHSGSPQQPRYYPPANSVEEIAKRYNLPPEDFERVMPLINDATQIQVRMAVTPLAMELQRVNTELAKKRVNEEMERDSVFKNRVVMQEMYQIMENDPSVQRAPVPLKAAYDRALQNMGRRFVEGLGTEVTDSEARSEIPTTPPPMGKSGQGSSRAQMKTIAGKMSQEKFNSLSSADMEKYLSQRGLVRHETF